MKGRRWPLVLLLVGVIAMAGHSRRAHADPIPAVYQPAGTVVVR